MTPQPVTANGVTFMVWADTFDAALRCACVHIAYLTGSRIIENVRRIA